MKNKQANNYFQRGIYRNKSSWTVKLPHKLTQHNTKSMVSKSAICEDQEIKTLVIKSDYSVVKQITYLINIQYCTKDSINPSTVLRLEVFSRNADRYKQYQ